MLKSLLKRQRKDMNSTYTKAIVNGIEYELSYSEDGKPILKIYDEEFKMWVINEFSIISTGINEVIKKDLSRVHIEEMAKSSLY